MRSEKLCEIADELREPVMQVGMSERDGYKTVRKWASLRCPHRSGCDKSAPRCDGMTPQNRQIISELKDRIFTFGFVAADQLFNRKG